jgi:phosphatidylglycerol---prolipoprotein diacylglyceryl transferase
MWVHNLDPTLLSLGSVEIRYYGLVYFVGALIAYWLLERARKKGDVPLEKNDTADLVTWLIIGVLVGSRLFYVLFYNFSSYINNPLRVFALWEGGLSFHGGLVGIIVAAYWFCKKRKMHFFDIADILSAPLMFALALGRIANFINGELWGTVWNGKWCVVFPAAGQECRHPYQLYDGIKRFVLTGWLVWLGRKNWKPGFIFWNFVFFEGLGRFVLDFWKGVDPVFWLKPGQWMSIVMMGIALWYFYTHHKEDCKKLWV